MIVVATVGILAALAVPAYLRFRLRGKASEVRINRASIATAAHAYFGEFNRFVAAIATPAGVPGPKRRPWSAGGPPDFDPLGLLPIGEVFFTYAVDPDPTNAPFTAAAQGDLDGNATPAEFGYVQPTAGSSAGVVSSLATTCSPNGVFSPNGLVLDTVRPCTPFDGGSRF